MAEYTWQNGGDDALVRLGLALYRETQLNGLKYYSVYDLVHNHLEQRTSSRLFSRLFRQAGNDFWGQAEELAKGLAATQIADHFSRPMDGERFLTEHMLRLTTFGRGLYDLAFVQTEGSSEIDGMTIEEAMEVLRDEKSAALLATDIENVGPSIDKLRLSNFQRSTVSCYVNMLIVVARMPDPDARLFWTLLNRLNAFAGVASLIVALIALRLQTR